MRKDRRRQKHLCPSVGGTWKARQFLPTNHLGVDHISTRGSKNLLERNAAKQFVIHLDLSSSTIYGAILIDISKNGIRKIEI